VHVLSLAQWHTKSCTFTVSFYRSICSKVEPDAEMRKFVILRLQKVLRNRPSVGEITLLGFRRRCNLIAPTESALRVTGSPGRYVFIVDDQQWMVGRRLVWIAAEDTADKRTMWWLQQQALPTGKTERVPSARLQSARAETENFVRARDAIKPPFILFR